MTTQPPSTSQPIKAEGEDHAHSLHPSSPVRIVFFATQLYALASGRSSGFGGAETELWNVARAAAELSQYDVRALTLTNETTQPISFGQLQLWPVPPAPSLTFAHSWFARRRAIIKYYARLFKALKNQRAQIYFTKLASSEVFTVWLASRITRGKFVFRVEHDWETSSETLTNMIFRGSKLWAALFRFSLRRADMVIAQTQKQSAALLKNFGISSVLIPNGHAIPPEDAIEHDPQRRPDVLWVARAHPMKRPMLFLDLAEANPALSFTMIMAESPEHTSLFEECRQRAETIKNFKFIPGLPPDELSAIYQSARMFVLTSEAEGFSNVIIEALKYGAPVVSLGHNPNDMLALSKSDASELAPSAGFFTDNSPEATQSLIHRLSHDTHFWQACHRDARTTASQNFGLPNILELYRENFQRLLTRP